MKHIVPKPLLKKRISDSSMSTVTSLIPRIDDPGDMTAFVPVDAVNDLENDDVIRCFTFLDVISTKK
jgi:hypothetical protein